MKDQPRKGSIDDAAGCAVILNKWVKTTTWMPRLYSENELLKMVEEAIPFRELWVIGNPASAYVSLIKIYCRLWHCIQISQEKVMVKYY